MKTLSDLMTRGVETVPPHATLQEAAQKMQRHDVGAIPVCDGERLLGMLTDRDITIRATAAGLDARTTRASDIMTDDVVYAYADDEIGTAARIMREAKIRRLPVVDRDQKLVGIVALGDLATEGGDDAATGEVLEGISQKGSHKG